MSEITLFRQERFDHGVRTGIGLNGETVFHHFLPGSGDVDPALLWYVDLSFSGAGLPTEPMACKAWILGQSATICQGIVEAAEHLELGVDVEDVRPYHKSLAGFPRDVVAELSATCVRRLSPGELSGHLTEISAGWGAIMAQLQPLAAV